MNTIDYFVAERIAVVLLSGLLGLTVSFFFGTKGVKGCLTYLISGIVIAIALYALINGRSEFVENLTQNLTYYITKDFSGVVGFFVGLFIGFGIKRKLKKQP